MAVLKIRLASFVGFGQLVRSGGPNSEQNETNPQNGVEHSKSSLPQSGTWQQLQAFCPTSAYFRLRATRATSFYRASAYLRASATRTPILHHNPPIPLPQFGTTWKHRHCHDYVEFKTLHTAGLGAVHRGRQQFCRLLG